MLDYYVCERWNDPMCSLTNSLKCESHLLKIHFLNIKCQIFTLESKSSLEQEFNSAVHSQVCEMLSSSRQN